MKIHRLEPEVEPANMGCTRRAPNQLRHPGDLLNLIMCIDSISAKAFTFGSAKLEQFLFHVGISSSPFQKNFAQEGTEGELSAIDFSRFLRVKVVISLFLNEQFLAAALNKASFVRLLVPNNTRIIGKIPHNFDHGHRRRSTVPKPPLTGNNLNMQPD
ncbi:hypothetical protein TNCV_4414131 [Trichonephila clavipes]|uniref:Uncharacterized protein n=1 Tax=Trichonephila clavipes TaxID=2585209 RepID=A0A8X6VFN3_TRICX|nr:hypothetical protein TNCV_4414131 [Trichonephila clavipes]